MEVGCLVEGDDVALHIVEIRHRALCKRRGHFFDPLDVKKAGTPHAQAAHGRLGDLEHNDAGIYALRRHGDGNGLVAFIMVGLLQRCAGIFNIFRRAARPSVAVERLVHRSGRKCLGTHHAKFAYGKCLRRLGIHDWRWLLINKRILVLCGQAARQGDGDSQYQVKDQASEADGVRTPNH